ncbi:DNA helicase [Limosilactobacillus equigenerosi DSM 18793 = JCM 14505]|uniref:DNA helicase n=1 Tax=Limosilactobacillus equigenerosi DSM 18793 = JCM 14505 TaxID=1423742 RepID=A0A0R1UUF1_9LACO|nr:DNA helicase [Limosilactobacillus equigenerosi DSM 18793 = JCM 14505]
MDIKSYEQHRLDDVIEKIDHAKQVAQQKLGKTKREMSDIQKGFDDIRMNTSTYSGMMDTAMSVRAQQQLLDERENTWQHAADQVTTLERLQAKPYFARIDFQETPDRPAETIYIGLASFADSPDHFLVYDWRAPISSIYYDGELGEIAYQTPDGEQTVNVQLKRQFQIEDGVIVTMYDTEEAVTDQMLLAALDNHSSTKMKSIVTTIQRQQNQIIRNTDAKLLFVQGAAGSGKTAAILQRVAWLLYRYRGHLTASQVIMFSPNQLFNDYIDQVLPELGEHNMVQMTYFQYLSRRVPKFKIESIQDRFEADQAPTHQKITALLTSWQYFNAVTRYAKRLGRDGHLRVKPIKFQGRDYFTKEKIAEIYYSFNQNYHLGNRIDATQEQLMKILNGRLGTEMKAKWVEEIIQTLSEEELRQMMADHPGELESEAAENKYISRRVVMQALLPVKRAIDHHRWLNINAQYVHLLRVTPKLVDLSAYGLTPTDWTNYVDGQVAKLKQRQLSAAGVSIYLYLYDLLTGKRGQREMRFVFVDEVQDYDAFQLAYLQFNFPKAKFTLLGDLNQAIFTHDQSHTLLQQLGQMFGHDDTKVVQLTKSYRSTQQITDFTKQLLLDGEQIEAFARQGELPLIYELADEKAAVDQVMATLQTDRQANDTTAIIGKTLADSERITELLQARGEKVTLIRTENQRLVPGTIVVPSYLAKGLEFDAVIVWNANQTQYQGDHERQLIYTICSRAMHNLTVTSIGPVTELIRQVDQKLYQKN